MIQVIKLANEYYPDFSVRHVRAVFTAPWGKRNVKMTFPGLSISRRFVSKQVFLYAPTLMSAPPASSVSPAPLPLRPVRLIARFHQLSRD